MPSTKEQFSHKLISVYFRERRALLCSGCGDSLFVSGRCAGTDTDGDWLLNTHATAPALSLQVFLPAAHYTALLYVKMMSTFIRTRSV